MKLYDGLALQMLAALNANSTSSWVGTTAAGGMSAAAAVDFYTTSDIFSTATTGSVLTGMLHTSSRIKFSTTPVPTFTTGGNPAGTRATAVFSFATTTGTVATAGTARYFAVLNTNTGTASGSHIVFTGSIGTTGSDINFNVVDWQVSDQVSITSLTFVQPE
jgi:hypothetical protein